MRTGIVILTSALLAVPGLAVEKIGQLRETQVMVSRDAFLKTAAASASAPFASRVSR